MAIREFKLLIDEDFLSEGELPERLAAVEKALGLSLDTLDEVERPVEGPCPVPGCAHEVAFRGKPICRMRPDELKEAVGASLRMLTGAGSGRTSDQIMQALVGAAAGGGSKGKA